MKEESRNSQEGFVLVVVALVLVVLVGFVALGVDVGVLYSARTSAQEVADAAALAGAATFVLQNTAPQPATATAHATQYAVNNSIMGHAVAVGDVSVSVDVLTRRVTVNVRSTQNTYFAQVIGPATANIAVEAIAEASIEATGAGPCSVKPWFVPNTAFSTNNACPACAAGETLVPPTGGPPTAYALSKIGQQFTVRSTRPADAMGPGNFYAINLPGDTGGSDYENNISGRCLPNPVVIQCADVYNVKTGNMVGPTTQGVRGLIGNPPDDTWVGVGDYLLANGTHSDISKALVMAPIWDTCGTAGFCPTGDFGNGGTINLGIIGFAVFFLEGIQGNDVTARLVNVSACDSTPGGGGGGPSTGGTVLSIPLRLVRLP